MFNREVVDPNYIYKFFALSTFNQLLGCKMKVNDLVSLACLQNRISKVCRMYTPAERPSVIFLK